jgi:hypothetical protein
MKKFVYLKNIKKLRYIFYYLKVRIETWKQGEKKRKSHFLLCQKEMKMNLVNYDFLLLVNFVVLLHLD